MYARECVFFVCAGVSAGACDDVYVLCVIVFV